MATKTTPNTTKAILEKISSSLKNTISRKEKKENPKRKFTPKELHKQELARETAILVATTRIS